MTVQQQYEETWDMRKKYEKIVEIVKECESTLNIKGILQFQKEGTIIGTYFDIKEVIEE